ncbi:helicase associated domain-containing protein, partial [Streptomyces sp. MAD19A]|uniref:helicase associated domain-containing protein n=1 Tax=Streptomyces sp. MAD19A TaxID=3242896 RepID=UPI003528E92F
RYHLGIREVLAAVTDVGGLQNLTGMLHPDSEIHLNAQARERVCALSRVPAAVLEGALPAWTRAEPHAHYPGGPAGRLTRGEEAVAPWGPACPACCAARTGRRVPARRYLAPQERVCGRHRYWLMFLPSTGGLPVPLASCPEVLQAHRRHVRLLERSAGEQAFDVARAVTGTWWHESWRADEDVWPARLEATRPSGADPIWWKTAARDLVTYPETVALARLLASRPLQLRTVTETRGHLPYRLGELPQLLAELADQLGRPWFTHHLATVTHGPLFTWAHSRVRAHTAPAPATQKALWAVHSAHRPRPLSDLLPHPLANGGTSPVPRPAKRLRGHSHQAERAFTQGLAHARAYHEEHGHLAVPKEDTPAGYPLGQWLANTRARHTRMPAHQAAALTALYPWWNAPWSTLWQRIWHQARTHHQVHGPLQPSRGFPGTSYNLGEWLYLQCTRYPALHPEQQRLLAEIGIDAAAAAAARPRRRSYAERFQVGLAHARAFANVHGNLAAVAQATLHDGYPLGRWLANQRNHRRSGRQPMPASRAQALAAIDPWWNPPWHLTWQRHYYRARDAAAGHPLHPENGFDGLDDSTARWLRTQCRTYDQLHPDQQRLLNAIGITAEAAHTVQPPAPAAKARKKAITPPTPQPVAKPPTAPRSRLGHRPDLVPGFERALEYARAYAAEHGHLAVPRAARHGGYPLGAWLFSQRNRAKQRARDRLPPSPHLQKLAVIDPWWNPPWDLHWQRNYYRARNHIEAGNPFDPAALIPSPSTALGSWTTRACLNYHRLHPEQQHLLAGLGITDDVAHARTRRAYPWRTAVEHAQAFAQAHGHLAVPRDTVQDGFPLGLWLNKQRYRTKKSGPTPAARALAAIDPWWNPPWGMTWQHAYQRARAESQTPATRRWINKQHRTWPLLHRDQQHLLTAAGLITA